MAFTKVVGAGIHTLSNITSHNINSSGIITATKFVGPIEGDITAVDATFTGNVSIAKTLTYEDVANVDSVGIVTARQGIEIPNDTYKLRAGTDLEMQVFHDGTDSLIKDTRDTGSVKIQADNFTVIDKDASQTMITAGVDGSVSLRHTGNQKIKTTSHGISVTGIGTFSDAVRIVKSSGPLLELTTNTGAADATLRLSEGTPGSTTNGGGMFYSGADNKLHITCGADLTTKRITITRDNGIVGINSSEPSGAQLVIKNSDDSNLNAISIFNDNGNMSSSLSQDSSGAGSYLQKDDAGTIKTFIRSYDSSYFLGGNIGIGTVSPTEKLEVNGNFVVAESIAVNRPRIVLSAPNEGSSNYRHLFGANLKVDSSATFTTPTANISGGGWEYLSANSLNAHGHIRYLSAPDTNGTSSTPLERLRIDATGRVLIGVDAATNSDSYVQAFKSSGNDATITVGNVATSASGLCRYDFAPSNKVVGSRIECHATEDFSTSANRTADLVFITRNNGILSERLRIKSDGKVGIGSEIPENKLKINVTSGNDGMVVQNTSSANIAFIGARNGDATLQIGQYGSTASGNVFGIAAANLAFMYTTSYASTHPSALLIGNSSNKDIIFATNATERLRIDSNGRLLLNDISSRAVANVTAQVQLEGTTANTSAISIVRNSASEYPPYLNFGKSRATSTGGTTIIHDDDSLGQIRFSGADGNDLTNHAASIEAFIDGTPGNNVTPGRLIFSTTSATGSDATEKFRISSNGQVCIGSGFVGGGGHLTIRSGGVNNYATQDYQYVGTPADNTTTLAQIRFTANTTGASVVQGAKIQAVSDAAWSATGDAPTRLEFHTAPDGSATMVNRMTIRSSGVVAINESDGGVIELTRTNTNTSGLCGKIVFGNTDWDSSMASIRSYQDGANDDANLKFYTQISAAGGEQERVGITSDGNVQIGTAINAGNTLRYLDVANYNTGGNAGAILRLLTTKSDGSNSATADIVKYKAGGLEFLNYENVGTTGYISFKTAQNNGSPVEQLRIKPDAGIDLPTANYEFTQNNFRSKTVDSIGNDNPASATGAMTSVEGSRHSWSNTGGICDLPDYKRGDWTILEVYGKVNPNSGGSGGYSDPFHMLIYQGYGWNGSALTSYIYHEFVGTPSNIRNTFPSGSGNTGYSGLEVKWYDGSSESSSCAYNSTTHYLRIKLDTGSFNTTYGCFASVRIFKRF